MSYQCTVPGCEAEATCLPGVAMPTKGVPIAEHRPLVNAINLPVCDTHFDDLHVDHFLTDEFKSQVERTLARHGRPSVNFGKAFMDKVELGSEVHRAFLEHRASKQ